MSRRRKVAASFVGLALVLALSLLGQRIYATRAKRGGQQAAPEDSTRVSALEVRRTRWEEWIYLYGTLKAKEVHALSPTSALYLEKLLKRAGQRVDRGEALAILETKEARTSLDAARARLEQAQRNYERIHSLHKAGGASSRELESARVELESARASFASVSRSFERTTLRSPVDGVVVEVHASEGELVQPGRAVAEVADLSSLEVEVEVPSILWRRASESRRALVQMNGREVEARVVESSIASGSLPGLGRVKLSLQNTLDLPLGSVVRVSLLLRELDGAISIPYDAVQWGSDGRPYVFVLEGERARKREIRIGSIYRGNVLVEEGLLEGERIAHEGAGFLADGSRVAVGGEARR